ncbi:MAG: UDP-N-acetylmuramoyl-L-alanine--D-glutamate ligase [Burkholderiaceae bacterium]|nr:UDP-N-acetylmuramoyl-L-alanine--D-glutamate ligase [Burkholderiaceae bacterium]
MNPNEPPHPDLLLGPEALFDTAGDAVAATDAGAGVCVSARGAALAGVLELTSPPLVAPSSVPAPSLAAPVVEGIEVCSNDVPAEEVSDAVFAAANIPPDDAVKVVVSVKSAPTVPTAWDPEAVPAVSAAQAAADFVAQIFADVSAPEAAPAALLPLEAVTESIEIPDEALLPTEAPAASVARLMHGQRILVLGLGASGLAMARWCARCGAEVTVADTRSAPPQLPLLQRELPQVRFVPGALDARLVEGAALSAVYRSPGLSPAEITPVLIAASACGISAEGELGLFSAALAALRASHGYAPAVLGITGTNGKTTVTALTGQLVERSGQSVAVAGNIGPTLLDTLAACLDTDALPQVWVLELSSFQLDGATRFEPTAATVLNITQDHLDWHGDMAAYAAAKAQVFGPTGLMVLNREDAAVMRMLAPPVRAKLQKPSQRTHITFGSDLPQRPGDFGIEIVGGMPWLVRAMDAESPRKRSRNDLPEDLHLQRLMPADALRIRGRHNATNALAALALAASTGAALAPLLYGLREYRGEPHRVESVALISGVEYFDDSKGTNVGATVAALSGLGAERRLVVILGGEGKGQDFAPLAAPVARYARAVVLVGRDAGVIRAALAESGIPLVDASTLPEAVALATQRAHAGDAVLLSPACASFDMFTSYEHRAQVFCDAVRAVAHDAGQSMEGMA